jgi:hypothetical protein
MCGPKWWGFSVKPHKEAERVVRNAIENLGYTVHDANVLFDANCPNIDLVVFGKSEVKYVQVKLSSRPATKGGTVVDGSPWTEDQLFKKAPIFNKHGDAPQAHLVIIAHKEREGCFTFYVAPPEHLTRAILPVARAFAEKPKLDGKRRKMFRKEMPLAKLKRYRGAWHQLGEPPGQSLQHS